MLDQAGSIAVRRNADDVAGKDIVMIVKLPILPGMAMPAPFPFLIVKPSSTPVGRAERNGRYGESSINNRLGGRIGRIPRCRKGTIASSAVRIDAGLRSLQGQGDVDGNTLLVDASCCRDYVAGCGRSNRDRDGLLAVAGESPLFASSPVLTLTK